MLECDIPGFEIKEKLGSGGMGSVYKALQTSLNRNVAIKILERESASEEFIKRFEREAKVLAKLSHNHIVSCYDAGITDTHLYIIMEYLSGGTLDGYLKEHGALSEEVALKVVIAIARGLSHALSNDIIHRDIKCENILLSHSLEEGISPDFPYVVKISDLGLGCHHFHVKDQIKLTVQGTFWGTPAVMAPEQFFGNSQIDQSIDIYSLGCLLYQVLTALTPFREEGAAKAIVGRKLKDGYLEKELQRNNDFSPGIGKLITKMTKPEVKERASCYGEVTGKAEILIQSKAFSKRKNSLSRYLMASLIVTILLLLSIFFYLPSATAKSEHAESGIEPTTSKENPPQETQKAEHIESKLGSITPKEEPTQKNIKISDKAIELINLKYSDRLKGWERQGNFWLVDDEGDGIIGRGKGKIELKHKLKYQYGKLIIQLNSADAQFFGFHLKGKQGEKLLDFIINNLDGNKFCIIKAKDKNHSLDINDSPELTVTLLWLPNKVELLIQDEKIDLPLMETMPSILSLFTKEGSTIFEKIQFYPGIEN
jgi:serine/threonine protein kinase